MTETPVSKPPLFSTDKKTALQAISMAQFIAFAPYVFQASVILRDSNILREIEQNKQGSTIDEIARKVNMSVYAVRILLEAGLGIGLVYLKEGKFFLAKTGHFFLNDTMTRINTDFMRDVCYKGAADLEASLREGKPVGLKHFGDWPTIYQGLASMEEPARSSWFNFDHHYSDNTFPHALPLIFAHNPKKVLDIGANTGEFALACLGYNSDVEVGLVDLPGQLNVARKIIEDAGLADRVKFYDTDLLDTSSELPQGYDVIWMSQFLDCFAEHQVIDILQKCHKALGDDGRIFVNETFWDRQQFEVSAFSLQMTSLYFTTMANGNSQMYAFGLFRQLIEQAGFEIMNITDDIGISHSVLELRRK